MGATEEPLTRQNTLPNSTHTYTHTQEEGKHRETQSNKQFEKLELDFAEKEEAFSQTSARWSTCAQTNLTGCHIEMRTVSRALIHPWYFFKCKVGCFYLLTQSPRPNSNMAPPFPVLPRPVRQGLSSHLPIHLKTPKSHWDPIWGKGRGLEQARSGEEPWKGRGKKNRTTWLRGK